MNLNTPSIPWTIRDKTTDMMTLKPSKQLKMPATQGEERASAVQGMFNRIASTYDLLNDGMTLGLHRHWKTRAVACLQLSKGSQVLDVCTGTGDFVRNLTPQVGEQGQITGIDFSEAMLAIAEQRFGGEPHVHFKQGDALALPFADNSFDGAIVGFGLRNVENIPRCIAEMTRVVRPGGWVVNLDTSPKTSIPGFWALFALMMPLIGHLVSNDAEAYRYLGESTRDFASPEELSRIFEAAGLIHIQTQSLALGTVGIQAGQVPF